MYSSSGICILLETYDRESQQWLLTRGKKPNFVNLFQKELDDILSNEEKRFASIFNGKITKLENKIYTFSNIIEWVDYYADLSFYTLFSKIISSEHKNKDLPYIFEESDSTFKVSELLPENVSENARNYLSFGYYQSFIIIRADKLDCLRPIIKQSHKEKYISKPDRVSSLMSIDHIKDNVVEMYKQYGFNEREMRFLVVYQK